MKQYGYARVSTKGQNNDRQVADILAYCEKQQFTVAGMFTETMTGNSRTEDRPVLVQLLALLRRGDRLIVTEISRLGRRTSEVLRTIETLSDKGVSVLALNYNLETLLPTGKKNPMAQLVFTFLAEFARLERETISDRVKSGLALARARGRVGGRPVGVVEDSVKVLAKYPDVVKNLERGLSIRETVRITGRSEGTVEKVRKAWAPPPAASLIS